MRQYAIVLILGLVLAFIAWQARTGIFRFKNPGEPANKYVRQMQEAQKLTEEEAALIAGRYPQAIVTPSGLRYVVQKAGAGNPPPVGARVTVHYQGTLLVGGRKFDSSYDRGQPFTFRVGHGEVIKGWDEAFARMTKGERRTLIIPWWLAYGETAHGSTIPARATLVFDVELLDIN